MLSGLNSHKHLSKSPFDGCRILMFLHELCPQTTSTVFQRERCHRTGDCHKVTDCVLWLKFKAFVQLVWRFVALLTGVRSSSSTTSRWKMSPATGRDFWLSIANFSPTNPRETRNTARFSPNPARRSYERDSAGAGQLHWTPDNDCYHSISL